MQADSSPPAPTGVALAAGFFAVSGALELGLSVLDAERPPGVAPLWDALGRALLHWLLAAGLRPRPPPPTPSPSPWRSPALRSASPPPSSSRASSRFPPAPFSSPGFAHPRPPGTSAGRSSDVEPVLWPWGAGPIMR